ncbi:PAS domain-containing protein [Elioraea rosea]|uniref:PAS domain-containing protein n=1 Tax=Elioraea rosea TaxID=2492390 RepID=UPI0013151695|nr:PAS domain-containing protein [Elioraea rosea]
MPTQAPEAAAALQAGRLLRLGAGISWAAGVLAFLLIAAAITGGLALRERMLDDARREVRAIAEMAASVVEMRLTTYDKALRRIGMQIAPGELASDEMALRLRDVLSLELESFPSVAVLMVVDDHGWVVAAARAVHTFGRDREVSALSNIGLLAGSHPSGTMIGPRHERASAAEGGGPGVVVISRPLLDGNHLAGAIEAAIPLEGPGKLLVAPALADGHLVTLARKDGRVLAERLSWGAGLPGAKLTASAPVEGFDLVVTVSRPRAIVLGPWERSVHAIAAVTILVCAAAALLALLARFATRREARLARTVAARAQASDEIADRMDIALWSFDARMMRFLHLSPSIERMTGYRASFLIENGLAALELIHPEDRARVRDAFAASPEAVAVEYRIRTASGGEAVHRISARPVRDEDGTLLRYDGMTLDVSHQRHVEAELDEARRVADLGAWQFDFVRQKLEWSPEVPGLLRLADDAVPTTKEGLLGLVDADELPALREVCRKVNAEGGAEADIPIRRGDGTTGWLWVEARVTRDASGKPLRLYGVCQDITDRKQAEERVARSGKLAALGQLTGGIAHDFNNLLGVVQLNLDLIADCATDATARECAASARMAAAQGAKLTAQLLAFARNQPSRGGVIDLAATFARLERMLESGLGRRVTLAISLEPGRLHAEADEAQFEAAVMNLAINARDAMPDGGPIAIAARAVTLAGAEAGALGLAAGDHVEISVADSGTGMTEEVLRRASEPFFTTKRSGRGAGLGLAMVEGFVRQAGGELRIESTRGRGTTVTFWLRRAAEPAEAAPAPQPPLRPSAAGARQRILFVEDEPGLRAAGARILTSAGYAVHEAATVEQALALADSLDPPPALLLTDIILGGPVDGFWLARTIRERIPGIAVIYASGYTGEDRPAETDGPMLAKPFGRAALEAAIAAALDQDAARAAA